MKGATIVVEESLEPTMPSCDQEFFVALGIAEI